MAKKIISSDLNAFLLRPKNSIKTKNKPLVVGGSGRKGIVSTAYEAENTAFIQQ